MKRLLTGFGVLGLFALGCSTPASRTSEAPVIPAALSIARASFGSSVGATGASVGVGARPLRASLPALADGAVRLAHGALPDAWIEQRALGVRPRAAQRADAALVFADASEGVDLVMTAEDHRFEELRVVTRREGLAPMRWSLQLGPRLTSLRLRDGRVEALEGDGTARLATAPLVAYDAKGRAVRLAIELLRAGPGYELVVTPDQDAELPVTVDPAWTATTALTYGRAYFGSVDLGGGKVMIVGGSGEPVLEVRGQKNVEIWDPKTSTWSAAAPMAVGRVFPIVTRLLDGRVLVVGGGAQGLTSWPINGCMQSAELYDPVTNKWTKAADAAVPRAWGGAMTLTSGKVLVFGGTSCGGELVTTELYDPSTNTWSPGPPMNQARTVWTNWAKLGVDQLVVAGSTAPFGRIDYFDGKKFVETGSMTADGREYPDAVVSLGNGKALIANGWYIDGTGIHASVAADVFDAATRKTTKAADSDGRWAAATAGLPGGKAMVISGQQVSSLNGTVAVYDSATNAWTSGGSTATAPRREQQAILSSAGQLLVAGNERGTKDVDLYDVCATGVLSDGVCCDKACLGACERCDLPGKVGTCSPIAAGPPREYRTCGDLTCGAAGACLTKCSKDSDCVGGKYCDAAGACKPRLDKGAACAASNACASGFCVDGVCCDAACDGQCEACNLTGIAGTCAPVSGEVHGARAPCEGATAECGKVCDGKDRRACVWRGTDVTCGDDGCLGNLARKKGVCREGKCDGEARDCSPYRCGAAGCPVGCTDPGECVQGFTCVDKLCIAPPKDTRCSDDRRSVLAFDGSVKESCKDFLCDGGACLAACRSSSDCFPGNVCDLGAKKCVVPSTAREPDDGGGCAMGSSPRPLGAFALALLGLGLLARRARSGARADG